MSSDEIMKSSIDDKPSIEELQVRNTFNASPQDKMDNKNKIGEKTVAVFKKPQAPIIGPRRGPKAGKIRRVVNDTAFLAPLPVNKGATKSTRREDDSKDKTDKNDKPSTSKIATEKKLTIHNAKSIRVSYLEPSWRGKPEGKYELEVLENGVIRETIDLTKNSFYVVGRLPSCSLSLAHPSISRYHAIIQYRAKEDENNSKGFYLYDLESTHGTFWNGHRIKPRCYVRLHGGHMITFGCVKKKYILQAPPEDQEEESELSVTQLKVSPVYIILFFFDGTAP